jgi:hypothetical protein
MQKAIEEEKSEESVCVLNGRVNNEKNDFYPLSNTHAATTKKE